MKKIALVFALLLITLYAAKGNFYVGNNDSIQSAIDAASNGDIIFVKGNHNESIFINKSIKIEGINHPFINSIEINASNVTIDNITTNEIIVNGNNESISNNIVYNGIIFNSSNSIVYHNFFINCSTGLLVNGSNNTIYQNGFFNSSYGIICKLNGNLIYHNNFIGNKINAIDYGNNTWNLSTPQEGNYWCDYNGSDNNGDGIGDTPYQINSSFDYYPLMQQYDIYPPVTNYSIVLLNGSMNNGWYIGNVSLVLMASDESGVNHTYYRIDNGTWMEYEKAINLTSDGVYYIQFRSVDILGLWEDVKNVTIKIDKTPPKLNYSIYPAEPTGKNGWYNESVEISFNAIDEHLKALYYRIDNGTWYPYEGYPVIPDGIHVIYLQAVDEAGNSNTTNFTIKIDTTPPSVKIEEINVSYVKGMYAIHYNATDNVDKNLSGNITLYYSPDNGSHWEFVSILNGSGEYNWYTNSFNDSGEALLKIVAIDDAGNAGVAYSNEFKVDNNPPHVIVTTPKEGETFGANETIEITWEAYDDVDKNLDGNISILYFYDGEWNYIVNGTANNGEYAFGTSGLQDGEYKIMVVAIDDAGNVGYGVTGNFTIDTTPPSVYISRPLTGFLYVNIMGREMLPPIPVPGIIYNAIIVGKITVDIEASDQYSGIQRVAVSTDEMQDVTIDEPYTWVWDPSFGVHYLKVTAWDNAGNMKSYEIDNILCINV